MSKKSKGLGDTIKKITSATKIDKLAKKIAKAVGKDDCGCDERQEKLNKMFPYNKPNCLTQEEHSYLTDFYSEQRNRISVEQQRELLTIYNRVFNYNDKLTSCGSCFAGKLNKLKSLFDKYE